MDNRQLIGYVSKLISISNLADCIGILVYGSYVGGRNNELSDLDVFVIKDNYETQDCGCLVIEDKKRTFNKLLQLYNYSFGELDFNPENFCLKFKKKAPFRI